MLQQYSGTSQFACKNWCKLHQGSNLLHHRKIPLVDALTGFKAGRHVFFQSGAGTATAEVDVSMLDKKERILRVNVTDIVCDSRAAAACAIAQHAYQRVWMRSARTM